MRWPKSFIFSVAAVGAALCVFASAANAKEIITLGNAHKLTEEPANCLDTDQNCALKTSDAEKFKLPMGEATILLDENTAVVRNSAQLLTLLAGSVWVSTNAEITIVSEYGSVVAYKGNFWVTHQQKKLLIEAIDTDLILKPRVSPSDLRLEAGEQNWLGPVAQNRYSASGIPLPIEPTQLLFRWAKLYPGTKKNFENDFKVFLESWKLSVEKLSEHHAMLAKRRVASIKEENERNRKIKQAREQEDSKIRKWFRQRELSN